MKTPLISLHSAFILPLMLLCTATGSAETDRTVLEIGFGSRLAARSVRTDDTAQTVAAGPWGHLESYSIYLQNPDAGNLPVDQFSTETRWHFPEKTQDEALQSLAALGIPEPFLKQNSYSLSSDFGTIICPSGTLLESLCAETRLRLRELLKAAPQNDWYMNPVVITSDRPAEWFTRAGLRGETARLIASLCYRTNGLTLFSDPVYVLSQIADREEKRRFMKTTTRIRTLVLRLGIGPETDLQALHRYWSLDNRRKEILPLLESIAEAPQNDQLDIIHLLPPSGRRQLYTYPRRDRPVNCFISSLEFAGFYPADLADNPDAYTAFFEEHLMQAKGSLQFGDLIVCFDKKSREPVHSAVYIAADIVFTKNGNSPDQPWVFMPWNEMIAIYTLDGDLFSKVYRAPSR